VKSVSFFGSKNEYILSGSDDGNIFIWDKKTAKLVNLMKGDEYIIEMSILLL
jgi:nuclear receptor interaction protein